MLLSVKMIVVRLIVLSVLAIGMRSLSLAQQPSARPDIFLITIDTLRADHVHCYGYTRIQTPALDALARNGIRFANAFTPSPITTSSHVSILTGLLPSVHGVTDFGMPLQPSHPTAARLLKQRGYQTAAFIGAVVLDSRALAPGLENGFDHYDNFPEAANTKSRWGRLERRGMDVVGRAEAWLSSHATGLHFVWLHLYDPHDPYEPPVPFSESYKGRLYDGEIAYADSALAHFVAYLKQHGLYQNALIVAVGDHGEGLGEHGEDTHGIFLYDSTTHVPLIFKLPSRVALEKVVEAQVRTVDIVPTLLEVASAPIPAGLTGESLQPYFNSREAPGRVSFAETDYPIGFGWAPLRSVRAEGYKFIEAPRPEFYELRPDPAERDNKYEPWETRVQKSRDLLAKLRSAAPGPTKSASAASPQTIAALRALGYLGRADAGSATAVPEPSLLPDPKDKIVEHNLLHKSMLESEAGHTSEAREVLEKLLQLDPDSYLALRQLGEIEILQGSAAPAIEHLRQACRLRPQDAGAALALAKALRETHDLSGARDALERSLELLPAQFDARFLLGQVYFDLKDLQAAEDQFEACVLLQPQRTTAKLWLARTQVAAGRFEDAVAEMQQLARVAPQNPDVFQLLSQAFRGLGRDAEAREADVRSRMKRKQPSSPPRAVVRQ